MERIWRVAINTNGFRSVLLVRGTEIETVDYLKSEIGYMPSYVAITEEEYEAYQALGFSAYLAPKREAI